MTAGGDRERRTAARVAPCGMEGVVSARLRSGHDAHLIDLSDRGALIECDHRLAPGARVTLQIFLSGRRFDVEGRIVRAEVIALCATAIRYRGAIRFDREVEGFERSLSLPAGNTPTPVATVELPRRRDNG